MELAQRVRRLSLTAQTHNKAAANSASGGLRHTMSLSPNIRHDSPPRYAATNITDDIQAAGSADSAAGPAVASSNLLTRSSSWNALPQVRLPRRVPSRVARVPSRSKGDHGTYAGGQGTCEGGQGTYEDDISSPRAPSHMSLLVASVGPRPL
eukprot:1818652-Rhodomonas_salina.1